MPFVRSRADDPVFVAVDVPSHSTHGHAYGHARSQPHSHSDVDGNSDSHGDDCGNAQALTCVHAKLVSSCTADAPLLQCRFACGKNRFPDDICVHTLDLPCLTSA